MRFALVAPNVGACADPRVLAGLARRGEEAGWDGFFLWDTVEYEAGIPVCDSMTALAAVAMATGRIRLGTMVLPLARRRPWKVAREAVTLDHLSGGRLVLGIGAGYEGSGFTRFGESADARTKATRLDEGLAILTGLWNGEPFSFEGRHYTVHDATFLPRPVNGAIPVWIAANHGLAVSGPVLRAARHDGILGGIDPDDVPELLALVRRRRPAGRAGERFDVAVGVEDPAKPLPSPETVAAWKQAGVTWVRYELDGLCGASESLDRSRRLIAAGPPR